MIARRHVFHIGCYDPILPETLLERFRRSLSSFEKTWSVSAKASGVLDATDVSASWRAETSGPNWTTETTYEMLRWDDLILQDHSRGMLSRLGAAFVTLGDWLVTGTLFRFFYASWKYAGFFLFMGAQMFSTRQEIPCGVSIGLQENDDELERQVEKELAAGYQRIKIKIKPGKDVQLAAAVRKEFPNITLSVDANSAYRIETDTALLKRLDDYDLLMIEQPLTPGDLLDHSKLQRTIRTPICLDESIVCLANARHAHELDACRIINIKLGRVGGFTEAKAIQAFAQQIGIPVWCGGMLEAGIGRAHNIALSTLENFRLPGDVSASARYWTEDIIEPEVTVTSDGEIIIPDSPGRGYEVRTDLVEKLTVRKEEIRALELVGRN